MTNTPETAPPKASDAAAGVWRAADPAKLLLLDFDEGVVVYHRPSGQTHVLNALAAEALILFSEAALTRDQLAERLIEAIGVDDDAAPGDRGFGAKADVIIDRFDVLGLVDRVDA